MRRYRVTYYLISDPERRVFSLFVQAETKNSVWNHDFLDDPDMVVLDIEESNHAV
jgi:hypothetical protein